MKFEVIMSNETTPKSYNIVAHHLANHEGITTGLLTFGLRNTQGGCSSCFQRILPHLIFLINAISSLSFILKQPQLTYY